MSCLDDDVTLSQISIPGTHDSATGDFHCDYTTLGCRYIVDQKSKIDETLKIGGRFIDLRSGVRTASNTYAKSFRTQQ